MPLTFLYRLYTVILFQVALFSGLLYLRPANSLLTALLWIPKLVAATTTPVIAAFSAGSTLLGLFRRDLKWILLGIFGTSMSTYYVYRIQMPDDDFAIAFGLDWQDRIPFDLRQHLLPRRWSPLAQTRQRVLREDDIIFGKHPRTGEDLFANLWYPAPGDRRNGLGIIYLHGGAWVYGHKEEGSRPLFRHLVQQGYTILDIAYSLWPKSEIHDIVNEVNQAVVWMKSVGSRFDINPHRVVLMGGSAGAHLALLAAFTAETSLFKPVPGDIDVSVCGVIAFYPPTDFISMYEDLQSARGELETVLKLTRIERSILTVLDMFGFIPSFDQNNPRFDFFATLLGGTPDQLPETYRLLSPIAHVGDHCPPTLLLQGTDDFFRLAPAVRRLHVALRAAGVPSVLVEYPYTEHAFDLVLPQISPAAQSATYDVERFLALLVNQ